MTSSKKIKLIIIEAGHLSKTAIAGGDRIMQEMAPYLQEKYPSEIIIPSIAMKHWKTSNIPLHLIPSIFLEKSKHPFFIFLTYLWRISYVCAYLLLKKESTYIIYSSTNLFVDSLPPFVVRLFKKNVFWIARIHHLIQHPNKRPGNFLTNLSSYILDQISLSCIKSAELILALNEELKYQIIKRKGFKHEKVRVLGAGIDLSYITTFTPTKSTISYDGVFVGRLHPTKGIYDLPSIWKQVVLKIPSARLGIIGEISDYLLYKKLKKEIIKQGLITSIDFLGFIAYEKLISTLKKSKVFLFTDHEAGWGIAVAEAMAAGLPVVGYHLPIFDTVYKKGVVTVPINEKEELAKETINLLQDEKLRKKLALEANQQVKTFDWSIVSAQFLTLVGKLIKKINED